MALKPPALKAGDTIGIVTLGSPLDAAVINSRINTLKNMGFNVITGKYVYSYSGYIAASDVERASDLMSMFQNPNVKAIIPTRGGVGVAGILPHLDYSVIRNNPKIITGYSDITILLNVLYQLTDLVTFHSLLLIDFAEDTPPYNLNQFFAATTTTYGQRVLENPPGIPTVSRVPGNVTGPIVGGNLISLTDSLGTPYEIDTRGKILFLEEVHEPVNKVYRHINHLRIARKFRDCLGIIMGQCTGCAEAYGKSYEDLINEAIVPLGKPLITNAATGHGQYKMAIPIGCRVNLDAVNNRITVLEPSVTSA